MIVVSLGLAYVEELEAPRALHNRMRGSLGEELVTVRVRRAIVGERIRELIGVLEKLKEEKLPESCLWEPVQSFCCCHLCCLHFWR